MDELLNEQCATASGPTLRRRGRRQAAMVIATPAILLSCVIAAPALAARTHVNRPDTRPASVGTTGAPTAAIGAQPPLTAVPTTSPTVADVLAVCGASERQARPSLATDFAPFFAATASLTEPAVPRYALPTSPGATPSVLGTASPAHSAPLYTVLARSTSTNEIAAIAAYVDGGVVNCQAASFGPATVEGNGSTGAVTPLLSSALNEGRTFLSIGLAGPSTASVTMGRRNHGHYAPGVVSGGGFAVLADTETSLLSGNLANASVAADQTITATDVRGSALAVQQLSTSQRG